MKQYAFVLGLCSVMLLSGCGKTVPPEESAVAHVVETTAPIKQSAIPEHSVYDPENPGRYYAETTLGIVPQNDYGKIFPYIGRLKKSAKTPTKIQSFWDGRDSLLYGFIDQNGRIICDPFYDKVELLTYGEKYAYLLSYSTGEPDYTTCCAIAGADGSFVYEYSAAESGSYSFFDGVILNRKPSELFYQEISAFEYIPVIKNGKWCVFDYDGKQVLPYDYPNAPLFNEGLAAVLENDTGDYYYINNSGAKVLGPYRSDSFDARDLIFHRGRAKYSDVVFIDKSGCQIQISVPPDYRDYLDFRCSNFKYADTSIVSAIGSYGDGEFLAQHCAIIDLEGNFLTPMMLGEMHYNIDGFYVLSGGMRPNIYEEEFYYEDGAKMPYDSTYKYDGDGYFFNLDQGDRIYDKIIGEIASANSKEFEIFEIDKGTDTGLRDTSLYGIKKKDGEILADAVFNYLTEIGGNYLAVQGDYSGLTDVNGNWIIKVSLLDESTASEQPKGNSITDYEYAIENNEATITAYIGAGTTPAIPSEINGIKVTTIGEGAFHGCEGLTSVEIPDSITSIGNNAFHGCKGLANITIPESVTHIGQAAFFRCESLTSVEIPNSVTCIDKEAFEACTGLKELTIPISVTSIEWATFSRCTGLKSVTIPNSVTSIKEYAFNHCRSLKSVIIPDSVTSIDHFVFDDCSSLVSVTIGNSVTSIGQGVFSDCTSLINVNIPSGVASIEYLTFGCCTSLKSVTIPDSVTSIGEYAFYGCTSLTNIIMPKKKISINDNAFEGTPVQESVKGLSK